MEYLYDTDTMNEILNANPIIIMDTNAWLDLYTFPPSLIKLIIDIIDENIDLFWLPNQVFIEFNRNVSQQRERALNRYTNSKKATCHILNDAKNKINAEMNKLINKENTEANSIYLPVISELDNQIKFIKEKIDEVNVNYTSQTSIIDKNNDNDIILNLINKLHENSNAKAFTVMQLINIYEEGETRYKYNISPGYTDKGKKGLSESLSQYNMRKYGDLILWKEILNKIHDQKIDLIFIQNEKKSDWWDQRESDKLPRILKEEFNQATLDNSNFIMIDFEEFIYHYGNKNNISDTSLKNILAKLEYRKNLLTYLDNNKEEFLETLIQEKYETWDYNNPLINEISELSFYGGSVESVDDLAIDNINIISSEMNYDEYEDLCYLESNIELSCSASICEYVSKYVYHSGTIELTCSFDFNLCCLLNISDTALEYNDAIETQDIDLDNLKIKDINNDNLDIDICVDEDIFRDR